MHTHEHIHSERKGDGQGMPMPDGDGTQDFDVTAVPADDAGCYVPTLPPRLQAAAAEVAARINPVNAPFTQSAFPESVPDDPAALAVLTSKYWGRQRRTLAVSFMEATPNDLKQRILQHMNAWGISVTFALTNGIGHVRISRGGQGYWSYLGTDITLIPQNRPTMNLQGFSMNTAESEYRRVVRHETGHTLGFPHEHLRRALINLLDPAKTIAYFRNTYGWSEAQTRSNVLTPLDERSIMGTPNADQDSIMCYRLPGQITKNGQPIRGGNDINLLDRAFSQLIYPAVGFSPSSSPTDTWDETEDVSVEDAVALARA